ncbi:HAF repeat-containing protein, partial [Singulisphaera rosea]
MQRVLLLTTAALMAPLASADEPTKGHPIRIVSPKDNGISATGINELGDIIGFEWRENKKYPGMLDQIPFFARGKEITPLPLLQGYTAAFPAAVDENGQVVGRVSRPPSKLSKVMRNQAFLWDAKSGIRGLGALDGDASSFACGITRDGRCISGYSVGEQRIRACVWEKRGERWEATALPHAARLGSQVVAISDDG